MSLTKKSRWTDGRIAVAALAVIAGLAVSLRPPAGVHAEAAPASYPLAGIIRDFRPGHTDFAAGRGDLLAYSVGNVSGTLSATGLPEYTGLGRAVTTAARDAQGRGIRPSTTGAHAVTDFHISGDSVVTNQPAVAKVTFVGSAFVDGFGISGRVNIGSTAHTPFGAFEGGSARNLIGQPSMEVVLPGTVSNSTPLTVDARCWHLGGGESMRVNSNSGGKQVQALRNGDSAPSVAGFGGQVSAKDMLTNYIDTATNKITLRDNQVIYLFEVGSTDTDSSAFDMQDLVVLVDLASDASYFEEPTTPATGCATIHDTAAVLGAADTGGVSSASSFAQWFTDVPGQNLSARQIIQMSRDPQGNYVYSTSNFDPINGALYGNQSASANRGFTFSIDAEMNYSKCAGQFLEFSGDADAWVFVNGKLALDMGGAHGTQSQVVDMDRLDLPDGQPARIQMFFAPRSSTAAFTLKSNAVMNSRTTIDAPPVSGLYD